MTTLVDQRVANWHRCLVRGPVLPTPVCCGREIRSVDELDRGLVVVWEWDLPIRPKGIVVTRAEHPHLVLRVGVEVFDGGAAYIFDPADALQRGEHIWASA